jgi:hypothetical protein
MTGESDRVVETLAMLYRYAEDHHGPDRESSPLTIALSREAGGRGSEIARVVGARLTWPVYDHELLTRIAEEKGLHRRLLENLDERHVTWLEDVITNFVSHEGGREGGYIRHLLEQFASLGRTGHCIIVGRGSAQVLPPETTLRVRVVAPPAFRIAAIEKEFGISHSEAERWVERTDLERARFVKYHFSKDVSNPLNYDLMLNSGRYSIEECAALIVEATRLMEARLHPQPVATAP